MTATDETLVQVLCAMLGQGIGALREGRYFAAGEHYVGAKNAAISIRDECINRRAMKLVVSFYVVGFGRDNSIRKCSFCGLPLVSCESSGTCDECSMHVFDKLLASKAWVVTAGRERVREMVKRRKRVSDRIEERYSFLRREPAPRGV